MDTPTKQPSASSSSPTFTNLTNLPYLAPTHPLLRPHLHLQPLQDSSHTHPTDRYSQPLPLRPLHVIHHSSFLLCLPSQKTQTPTSPHCLSPGPLSLPSTLMDPATQTTVVGPYPLAQGSTAPRKKSNSLLHPLASRKPTPSHAPNWPPSGPAYAMLLKMKP